MDAPLSATVMKQALNALESKLTSPLRLLIGGGGAMILAHNYPLATTDIDAIPFLLSADELHPLVETIAKELSLPGDWLNPHFASFSYVLPIDYKDRLITVFSGKYLQAQALGKEDMLIMKCFAHRVKDRGHAHALIKSGADVQMVERHIDALLSKGIAEAQKALDFLDDLMEEFS